MTSGLEDGSPTNVTLEGWDFDIQESYELRVRRKGKLFRIILSPIPLLNYDTKSAMEVRFLKRLDTALEREDTIEEWRIHKEIRNFAINLCSDWLEKLAPALEEIASDNSLDSLLYPETFILQLVTSKGEPKVIKREEYALHSSTFTHVDTQNFSLSLPRYKLEQIGVLENLYRHRVLKVLVDGQRLCCKLALHPYPNISREISMLEAIERADLSPSTKIPRIRGLVMSKDGLSVIGFLMDYIARDKHIRNLGCLKYEMTTIKRGRKQKWMNQVTETVTTLHEGGVIWGDAKADNILIDEEDNAWLIDFGGSWTENWVPEKLQDSKEGDLHALELIHEFLELRGRG